MTRLAHIVEQRRIALLKQWVKDPCVQVQVEEPSILGRLIDLGSDTEATLSNVGRRRRDNAVLVQTGSGTDGQSLWVAASYKGYREAFRLFLAIAYGVEVNKEEMSAFDVDHLLNRARSPDDACFLRIEAIEREINQSWGATFEKAASHPEFYANKMRTRRTMSWMIAAKLSGQAPPAGPKDERGIQRLGTQFQSLGLAKKEAVEGVRSMMEFAYSRTS